MSIIGTSLVRKKKRGLKDSTPNLSKEALLEKMGNAFIDHKNFVGNAFNETMRQIATSFIECNETSTEKKKPKI